MKSRFPALAWSAIGVVLFVAALLIVPRPAGGADSTKTAAPPAAERLILRYANGTIEVVTRTPLNKPVPPSQSMPAAKGEVRGNWFELQADNGDVVYRRGMAAPDLVYTEVPTAENPSQLSRAEFVVPEKTFSILVPIKSDGNYLVLYGAPVGSKSRNQAAGEIGRIRLR